MKEERLEGNLSSLQEKMRSLVAENAAFKDQIQKLGSLQQESGMLTAKVTGLQKLLETVSAERDQLKSALEATQAQVLYTYIVCAVLCTYMCVCACIRACVCACLSVCV